MHVDLISAPLLQWYDKNARALPWRMAPGGAALPDPYGVWLSEIMLQQTTVAMGAPYWRRFMTLWPNVQALAGADDADVMREWAGLGYYARARNLLMAARVMAAEGFPQTEAGLRALPGLGDYTAAAVAAIAFGEPTIAIDANVARVGARLFAIAEPMPGARRQLRAALLPHVPEERPGDFLQALMDLGSGICTPRKPRCMICPIREACEAARMGDPERFPTAKEKRVRPVRQGLVWWISNGTHVALIRRPAKGLLGGMVALPGTEWSADEQHSFPFEADWALIGPRVRHVFTHFELQLSVATARAPVGLDAVSGQPLLWIPIEDIASAGLPTLYARAAALVGEAA